MCIVNAGKSYFWRTFYNQLHKNDAAYVAEALIKQINYLIENEIKFVGTRVDTYVYTYLHIHIQTYICA